MKFKIGDKVKFRVSSLDNEIWVEGYLEYVRCSLPDRPGVVEIITQEGNLYKSWPPYEAVMTMMPICEPNDLLKKVLLKEIL